MSQSNSQTLNQIVVGMMAVMAAIVLLYVGFQFGEWLRA